MPVANQTHHGHEGPPAQVDRAEIRVEVVDQRRQLCEVDRIAAACEPRERVTLATIVVEIAREPSTFESIQGCLSTRLDELRAVISTFARADAIMVERLYQTVKALPPPSMCASTQPTGPRRIQAAVARHSGSLDAVDVRLPDAQVASHLDVVAQPSRLERLERAAIAGDARAREREILDAQHGLLAGEPCGEVRQEDLRRRRESGARGGRPLEPARDRHLEAGALGERLCDGAGQPGDEQVAMHRPSLHVTGT